MLLLPTPHHSDYLIKFEAPKAVTHFAGHEGDE